MKYHIIQVYKETKNKYYFLDNQIAYNNIEENLVIIDQNKNVYHLPKMESITIGSIKMFAKGIETATKNKFTYWEVEI